MPDAETVRRLALALPEVRDASEGARLAFEIEGRGFAWTWLERVDPKRPRARDPRSSPSAASCRARRC
jgi:hypothetical protein